MDNTPTMPRRKTPTSSIYPALHQQISDQLEEDDLLFSFEPNVKMSCLKECDTYIMGRFGCKNVKCSNAFWSSKKIAITIRLYSGNRYNAQIYHQRCQFCDQLSIPELDEQSYVDRVVYRLKKWAGIDVERPYYKKKAGKPHLKAFCEGCKVGHCKDGFTEEYDDLSDFVSRTSRLHL